MLKRAMSFGFESVLGAVVACGVLLLSACTSGGGGIGLGGGGAAKYSISGTVTGLSGTLVLTDNGTDDVTMARDGAFTFAAQLATGANYSVAIKSQPATQTCSVANGGGTVAAANVANISIVCATNPSVTARIAAQTTVAVGTAMSFDASGSLSSVGLPINYSWDFGDGAHGGGVKLSRAFSKAGSYAVTLTVMDSEGRADSKTQSVVVTDVATGPAVNMIMSIADLSNAPMSGVNASVVNGASTAVSNSAGQATLSVPTDANVLIKLTKDGYSDQFVPVRFPKSTGADAYAQSHMIAREGALTLPDAAQGGTLIGKDGVKLVLNPNSLVDAAGRAATGTIQISMTPVNVTINAIAAFPGLFVGVTTDTLTTSIVSYGSVEFALTQNGQRLQIAVGKTATVEIPSYPNAHADGTAVGLGEIVPLWSLDENSGLWIQEGMGEVVASSGSPTGLALRATVAHMSWWNMDHSIDSSYNPQPQCTDGTIGVPGDTDHLANETICNMLAQFDNASNGGNAAAMTSSVIATAAPAIFIKPGYGGTFTVPMSGGAAIRLPADQSMLLSASAMNGTWLGHLTVSGKAGDTPKIVIPLFPVATAPTDESIALPFDATRSLDAGKTSRLRFTTDGTKPVNIVFAHGAGSNFTGHIRLLQGSTVLANADFGSTATVLSSSLLAAGDYVIEIVSTGTTAATFSLQASFVHWAAPAQSIGGINRVLQMQLFYDSQARVVLMDKEVYTPSDNAAVRNARLVFRRLSGGTWVSAADSVELGLYQFGSNAGAQIGFALDRNDHPAYVTENSDGQSYSVHQWTGAQWQGVGNGGTGQLPLTGGISSQVAPPIIRFDSGNKPIVAYSIRAAGQSVAGEIVTDKFNGTNWVAIGPNNGAQVVTPSAGTTWFAFELSTDDQPFVAMGNVDGGCSASPTYVTRYVDTPSPAWVGVGGNNGLLPAPATAGFSVARAGTLSIDAQGRPTLAADVCGAGNGGLINSAVEVLRFDGVAWSASPAHTVNAGGYVFSYPQLSAQFVSLDSTGNAVVAWEEAESVNLGANRRYFVQVLNGGTWTGLGSAAGLVDGLTYPSVDVNTPYSQLRMARDAHGNTAIAYVQDSSGANAANTIGVAVYVP